jgi:hypothetical protein
LFYNKLSAKIRIVWFSSALALFILTLSVIQKIKIGPVIKLDGSAIHPYTSLVISMFDNEQLKNFFSHSFGINSTLKYIIWICFMAFMLFICTLGLFGISYLILLYIQRKKIKLPILILPMAFIINYLIMSLGLAYNTPVSAPNGMGTSEELLHRPFVWVYYFVNIWVGGAIYYNFRDYFSHLNKIQKSIISFIVIILFIIPVEFGMTLQKGPQSLQYYANNPVPTGLINSCDFIKKHSDILSLVQDSENDRNGYVTCLLERQAFVMKYYNVVRGPDQIERLKMMDQLKFMTNKDEIKYFLSGNKISWYILHPEDQVFWPKDLLNKSVYNSYGYRVFSLKDSFN